MELKLTRRNFLGSAAVVSETTLRPSKASALSRTMVAESNAAAKGEDLANATLTRAAVAKIKWKAEPFTMTEVRLLPIFWKNMMELDRRYLYSLPNDRLAHNLRVTAGISSDAYPPGGWEAPDCELGGHYVGHYLSSRALLHTSTGDEAVAAKANALVVILAQCLAKDGYLGAYPATFYDRCRAHQKVWAPFYTYHKILARMIDMYEHTGDQPALEVGLKMAVWADAYVSTFSDHEWQKVLLVEHGGMNEVSFNLYAITGNIEYRDLGYRFDHKNVFEPLAANQDTLSGNHANTNIPRIIGAIRGYDLTGDALFESIAENFYRVVNERHSYCTGGTSNGEMWHEPNGIAAQLGAAAEECCCSYNTMKLTRHLFGQKPDAKHFDYCERMLLNVRYGRQDRNGMLVYYVSLRPGMYKTLGTQFDAFWCCTGTGSEEYAKLNDSIYFRDESSVYTNLFIPSKLEWKERGLRLTQTTKYPNEQLVTCVVDAAPSKPTTLKIRVPYWATKRVAVAVNGEMVSVMATPSTCHELNYPWKTGDVITVEMPMTLHIDQAPDDKQVQAAMYGPLVLSVLQGSEDLTNSVIYGDTGPFGSNDGYPMPTANLHLMSHRHHELATIPVAPHAAEYNIWFEQVEATRRYPLQFRTRGRGPTDTLVPLNLIMDERCSVYVRDDMIV